MPVRFGFGVRAEALSHRWHCCSKSRTSDASVCSDKVVLAKAIA